MKLRYVHCPQAIRPHVFLFSIDDASERGIENYFQEILAWMRQELDPATWQSRNLTIQVGDPSVATIVRLRWC